VWLVYLRPPRPLAARFAAHLNADAFTERLLNAAANEIRFSHLKPPSLSERPLVRSREAVALATRLSANRKTHCLPRGRAAQRVKQQRNRKEKMSLCHKEITKIVNVSSKRVDFF
jgi:hypothetical protein